MSSSTKGFVFLVTAIIIMFGVSGAIDRLPPDAGYYHWSGMILALIVAFISGILGYSYINEKNER